MYVPADFESLLRPFMMDGQAFSFKVLPHFEMKKRMQTDPDVRAAMATGNNKDIGKCSLPSPVTCASNDIEVAT